MTPGVVFVVLHIGAWFTLEMLYVVCARFAVEMLYQLVWVYAWFTVEMLYQLVWAYARLLLKCCINLYGLCVVYC